MGLTERELQVIATRMATDMVDHPSGERLDYYQRAIAPFGISDLLYVNAHLINVLTEIITAQMDTFPALRHIADQREAEFRAQLGPLPAEYLAERDAAEE